MKRGPGQCRADSRIDPAE
eukprot:Gb_41358 [translate_table: standard]